MRSLLGFLLGLYCLWCACAPTGGAGLPCDVRAGLAHAGAFEILALDPYRIDYAALSGERSLALHGFEVLRSAPVFEPHLRAEILAQVETGLLEGAAQRPACFNPRHGIRAWTERGKLELLLCYECRSIQMYVDGRFTGVAATSDGPARRLDAIWAELGCRVAD